MMPSVLEAHIQETWNFEKGFLMMKLGGCPKTRMGAFLLVGMAGSVRSERELHCKVFASKRTPCMLRGHHTTEHVTRWCGSLM